jgi:polar amino acid transport system permease protein
MGGEVSRRQGRTFFPSAQIATPWWLIIILLGGAFVLYSMLQQEGYVRAFTYLLRGVSKTVYLTIASYAVALALGLIAGLGRVSRNTVLYTLSTVYVEVIRGIPLLLIILITHLVIAPALGTNRNLDISAIIALSVGYGAYLAEVYRAGIESVERGQMEAGRSLGMSYGQTMRLVVLPQAIRRVLPPLGNDFIAMLKDTALVSVIGVEELTQLSRIEGSRTFDYLRALSAAAVLYLMLTLLLSLGVRLIERRTSSGRR